LSAIICIRFPHNECVAEIMSHTTCFSPCLSVPEKPLQERKRGGGEFLYHLYRNRPECAKICRSRLFAKARRPMNRHRSAPCRNVL
jgi:hypothetical protein